LGHNDADKIRVGQNEDREKHGQGVWFFNADAHGAGGVDRVLFLAGAPQRVQAQASYPITCRGAGAMTFQIWHVGGRAWGC
jgi:hypothetical protein